MNLFKTSFYSALSTTVNLIFRLITNKIIAVYLGTNGMFLLGQLKDFISISSSVGNLGTTNGIIKYTAEYKEEPKKLNSFLDTGLKIHLYSAIIVCVLTLAFRNQISNYLFNDLEFSNSLALLSFSFVTLSLQSFFMAVFNGLKQIITYVKINIISTIISTLLIIFLVIKLNVIGAFYAMALNQILVLIITFYWLKKLPYSKSNSLTLAINKKHFKNLTQFSLMAIFAQLCLISATLFVRFYLNNKLGYDYAGSWEGMWRLSAIYGIFITTTFQFYLLPTFSSITDKYLKKEIFKVWTYSIPAIIIATLSVYLLKDFIIRFIFSDEFLLINSIILFHLLGDIFKINTWVLANVLISKARTKTYIAFQFAWAIEFSIFVILFVKNYGFVGVSYAYFGACVINFISMNLYFRKLLWIKIRK